MRLFVGLDVPEALAGRLAALLPSTVAGVRGIAPSDMHVTLHFLGDRDPDAAARALGGVRAAAPEIRLRGLGRFRLRGGQRVIWAGIVTTPALLELHDAVGRALVPTGFEPETRPFRPHVTLARVGRRVPGSAFDTLIAAEATRDYGAFRPSALHLYDTLPPAGPGRYTRLKTWPLSA